MGRIFNRKEYQSPVVQHPDMNAIMESDRKFQEESRHANSFWGKAENFIKGLGQITPQQIVQGAKSPFQGIARSAGSLALQSYNVGREKPINEVKPEEIKSKFGQQVYKQAFGNESIKSLDQRINESKDWFKQRGLGEHSSNAFGNLAAAGSIALDLFPGTAGEKTAIKAIAKTQNIDDIVKHLIDLKIPQDEAHALAPSLKDVSDPDMVLKGITSFKKGIIDHGIKTGDASITPETINQHNSDVADSFKTKSPESSVVSKEIQQPQLTDINNQTNIEQGISKETETPQLPAKQTVPQDKNLQQPELPQVLPNQQSLPKLSSYKDDIGKIANSELNTAHILVSPESKKIIADTVEEVKPLIEKYIGKTLSNEEALNLAERSGKTLSKTVGRDETLAWQASMIKARQALAHASESGTVDEEYIKNLLTIKTQGTDIARKLQSLSIGARGVEPTAKEAILEAVLKVNDNLDEILKAAQGVDFNNLEQATEFYRTFVKPKASEWLDLVRYNSMLSSPKTHIVNIFSNLLNSGLIAPIEKTLTGGLDFLGSKITGKARTAFTGEGGAYLKHYFSNIKEATARFADVMGGRRGFTNLDIREVPLSTKGAKGKVVKVLSYPMKLLEGMDQFFTALAEGAETGALKYRASKGGKTGNITAEAQRAARYRLFRQKPLEGNEGPMLEAIDQFTVMIQALRNNKNPIVSTIAKFTVPFIQTPMNVLKQGFEYSPLGFTTIPGAANKTEQLSKAIIGSTVFAGAGMLALSNRLTFSEPTSTTAKNEFRAAGMQPYSVKVGDHWLSYQKMPPAVAFPFAMTAAIQEAIKNKKIDDDTVSLILSSIAKYGTFLADQSYVKSVGDILNAAKGGEAGVARVISNYAQQLIPFRAFGGWLAKITDGVQRTVDPKADFVDKQVQLLMMNIPGLSQKVPARKDLQGNEIKHPNPLSNAFNPIQTTNQTEEQAQEYESGQQYKSATKKSTELKTKAKKKVQGIYDQAQQLLEEGNQAEAQDLIDGLSDEDYAAYKSIRTSARSANTLAGEKKMFSTVLKVKELNDSGRTDEAQAIVDDMTDEEYRLYSLAKKKL